MDEFAVYLVALTPEAEASMRGERMRLRTFPFRVGRESRIVRGRHGLEVHERRRPTVSPSNDLYLLDAGHPLNVSRAHFQIEQHANRFILRDRGSALGTYVGESLVGGHDREDERTLGSGDILVVGSTQSPFVFRFVIETEATSS